MDCGHHESLTMPTSMIVSILPTPSNPRPPGARASERVRHQRVHDGLHPGAGPGVLHPEWDASLGLGPRETQQAQPPDQGRHILHLEELPHNDFVDPGKPLYVLRTMNSNPASTTVHVRHLLDEIESSEPSCSSRPSTVHGLRPCPEPSVEH